MNNKKHLFRFLALAMGLYLLWFVVYDLWLVKEGSLDSWLTAQVAKGSSNLLGLFGYESGLRNSIVYIENRPMVFVGNPCNGLVLMALFAGFIVAFPGSSIRKLYYLPAGIIAIFVLNVIRVMALALTALYYPTWIDFNHKYTFTFVVYACIFGMWMLWVKKLSNLTISATNANAATKMA